MTYHGVKEFQNSLIWFWYFFSFVVLIKIHRLRGSFVCFKDFIFICFFFFDFFDSTNVYEGYNRSPRQAQQQGHKEDRTKLLILLSNTTRLVGIGYMIRLFVGGAKTTAMYCLLLNLLSRVMLMAS